MKLYDCHQVAYINFSAAELLMITGLLIVYVSFSKPFLRVRQTTLTDASKGNHIQQNDSKYIINCAADNQAVIWSLGGCFVVSCMLLPQILHVRCSIRAFTVALAATAGHKCHICARIIVCLVYYRELYIYKLTAALLLRVPARLLLLV